MKYKGMKVELITEGFWPEGVELICSDDGVEWHSSTFVCLHSGRGFRSNGTTSSHWEYWAILPPKKAPRRLTNREVAKLCRAGWDVICDKEFVGQSYSYYVKYENEEVDNSIHVRAADSDEWVEPTSDLLEVG